MKPINETFMNGITRQLGFEKYIRIINDIDPLNNSFQVTFNDYYKMRHDANWQTSCYKYLYENRPRTELHEMGCLRC